MISDGEAVEEGEEMEDVEPTCEPYKVSEKCKPEAVGRERGRERGTRRIGVQVETSGGEPFEEGEEMEDVDPSSGSEIPTGNGKLDAGARKR